MKPAFDCASGMAPGPPRRAGITEILPIALALGRLLREKPASSAIFATVPPASRKDNCAYGGEAKPMPSYLDLGLIVVVLISAFLAMLRGFTREVLAIASWGAAAVAAFYFHPLVVPYIKTYIKADLNENYARGLSAAVVFLVTLIIVWMITIKLSDAILDSKVGALDRSLGFLFGAVRGLLLCVIAFLFFNWLVPAQTQPGFVKTARMRPLLQATGDQLIAALPLPDEVEAFLNKLKKPKSAGASEETVPDSDQEPKKADTGNGT
jgi:membrane protein required for colicin V production